MKNKYLKISTLWKKGTTLTLGLGLLSGGMSAEAATNCNAVTQISKMECESLLELYRSTNGGGWWSKNDGWNMTNTPCHWEGVTCINGGVTSIDLFYSRLTGAIPDFSGLPNLRELSLSSNQLTGAIPDFSGLANLQRLNLYSNQLTGVIPDFSRLPNLQGLYLSSNQLTGAIPDFSALPNLQGLDLSSNQLTGTIPDFSALLQLQSFNFSGNQLTLEGTNCDAVTQISKVECESLLELYHSTNVEVSRRNEGWNVTNIPCSWKGVACENGGVTRIHFSVDQLTGTIPDFSGLPNLLELDLSKNQLTGTIPDFSGLPNLLVLALSDNQLTGEIPDFSTLPKLQILELNNNQLTGVIPDFSALPWLESFRFSGNQLTLMNINCYAVTEISIIECKSLLELFNGTNGTNWKQNSGWNFTNTPCSWYGVTCENGVVGKIDLSHNRLTGEIPDFSALPNLQSLSLSNNQLTGTIPDFSALPNLQSLFLSNNQLTGAIPDFSALPNLQMLFLSNNQLTVIPNFSALPNLEMLYLSNNQLTGAIPDFNALPILQSFELSDNQLTGAIPDFSALPNLRYFRFTGNQLTLRNTNCNAVTQISKVECESLLELYHSTNGTQWRNNKDYEGWNVTNTPCTWEGVTCENGGVTQIHLRNYDSTHQPTSHQLKGTLPNFKGLPNLQSLSLSSNQLTGTIPDFSALPNLRAFRLRNNQLTGSIPDFSALPNLQELILSANQLTGAIPDFSALPNLQSLELSYNQFTGAIPDFSALPNLQTLYLEDNQLTGAIPDFSALPNLQDFRFSGNQLTVTDINCNAVTQISKIECESLLEFYHSTNGAGWRNNTGWNVTNTPCRWYGVTCENGGVTEITLFHPDIFYPVYSSAPQGNSLYGTLPNFKGLPNLQKLDLRYNKYGLTGAIPDFSALPNLQVLYLSDNRLTGTIPNFSALPNLEYLYLNNNQLTGAIPDFSALPNLQALHLSGNKLTGTIPDFSALTQLETLFFPYSDKLCKDANINYSSWQEERMNTFTNCPVTVKMQLNQSRYTTGDSLRLDMQVNGKAKADLYVAIVFPSGDLITIAYPLSFSQFNAVQIYQPAIEIAGKKIYPIMDFPLPAGIAIGNYHACGVLVLAGEYHSEDNWIDKHCIGFEVY